MGRLGVQKSHRTGNACHSPHHVIQTRLVVVVPHSRLSFQWTKIHSTRIQLAALFFHAYTQHRSYLIILGQPRDRIQIHRRFSERATYHI